MTRGEEVKRESRPSTEEPGAASDARRDSGVDCSLVDELLALTPEQRLAWLSSVIETATEVRNAADPGPDRTPGQSG